MNQKLRPLLLQAVTAVALALVYLLASGVLFTDSTAIFGLNFGAFYIDIIAFFIMLQALKFLRNRYPADQNSLGPIGVLLQRMLLLLVPIIILIRIAVELKIQSGDWLSFVSFSRISSYTTVASIILFLYVGLDMGYELMEKWRRSEAEKEKLHRLHAQAQLENLKAQVNPHFLFNSLNTLSSLITEDEERARQFVRQLSSVYRYILENRAKDTVPLANEVKLFESYVYLCETRFEDNINVHSEWPSDLDRWRIPPMTLQILVENAIKHNVISKSRPLSLWVKYEHGMLSVGNTNQPKKQLETGTGFGLSNIRERYAQLSKDEVTIEITEEEFIVTLPLLEK